MSRKTLYSLVEHFRNNSAGKQLLTKDSNSTQRSMHSGQSVTSNINFRNWGMFSNQSNLNVALAKKKKIKKEKDVKIKEEPE